MKNIKKEKGITLIALVITVVILLIISNAIIYNSTNQISIKKVNNLYSDIDSIKSKVSEYYLTYKELPVLCEYLSKDNLINLIKANATNNGAELQDSSNVVNEDDGDEYYVIDLGKLEGLSLTYGYDDDYTTVKENKAYTSSDVEDEIYVINYKTHQIYFPHGVFVDNMMYYTYSD